MGTRTLENQFVRTEVESRYTWLERLTLRKFHPRKIFFDLASGMWAVYFLWYQDWQRALLVGLTISLLGYISVWNVDVEKMSETPLGKLALLHLHPFNLITQLIGLVPLVYGIWIHSTEYILGGLSIVMIGHAYGWWKVNSAYAVDNSKWA